jgi:tetrahydrodipicolinate N-succinyltransferase
LGFVRRDTIEAEEDNPLVIGHDVWIGERVSILSGCRSIGNGAVIAAGSVVTHDVPWYSLVAGVPARPLKFRFDDATIEQLERSEWWNLSLPEILEYREWLLEKVTVQTARSLKERIVNMRP